MQEPPDLPPRSVPHQHAGTTRFDTEAVRRAELDPPGARDDVMPYDVAPAPVPRERLFSRKVMAAWALGTLIVWILVQVFRGPVRDAVLDRMEPPGSNTAAPEIAPVAPAEPNPALAPTPSMKEPTPDATVNPPAAAAATNAPGGARRR